MLLAAAVFVTIAWITREVQGIRERAALQQTLTDMQLSYDTLRDGVRRLAEDFFVLQHVLLERQVVIESELARGRSRLIEQPRRRAQQKRAISQHFGPGQAPLLVDDNEQQVH